MCVIGLGIDLVDIRRVEKVLHRFGERFERRVLTNRERQLANSHVHKARMIAKRFAAKEACAKALGTGFTQGICFTDMDISNDVSGKPIMNVYGKTQQKLQDMAPQSRYSDILVSLTDDYPYAYAQVIIHAIDK